MRMVKRIGDRSGGKRSSRALSNNFKFATGRRSRNRKLRLENLEDRTLLAASSISILAAGVSGEESIELSIDGTPVAVFDNVAGDPSTGLFEQFDYSHPARLVPEQIKIAFLNDGTTDLGINRDVRIDGFLLDGVKYETEDASVLSVGSWRASDGCDPGYKQSEWLNCPGSFTFQSSGTQIEVYAAGATGEEVIELLVDGTVAATFDQVGGDTDTGSFQTFSYSHHQSLVPGQVEVSFVNEGVDSQGTERLVRVDGISLNGRKYETEAATVYSYGDWDDDPERTPGFNQTESLSVNGTFRYGVAGSEIEIYAAGQTGQETLELLIDGLPVATFENVGGDALGGTFQTLSYSHPTVLSSTNLIEVGFTNDSFISPTEDRNLRVDGISLNGQKFESEAPEVVSVGSWRESDGCEPGNKQSEWLHCNGAFAYELPGSIVEVHAAGETGEEIIELQVDGETVATFGPVGGDVFGGTDSEGVFETFLYYSPEVLSAEQLRVAFVNDGNVTGDRNVRVDSITLDGVEHQSEDPNVFSTGTWVPALNNLIWGYHSADFLHADGYFQYGNSGSTIKIFAAGETAEEFMELQIDGETVATFNSLNQGAATGDFQTFTYLHSEPVTVDQVKVAFVNDGVSASSIERGLRIDGLQIDSQFWETEDLNTLSTGTLVPGVGVLEGHWESEYLTDNGYMQFDVAFDPGSLALLTNAISVDEAGGTATLPVVRTGELTVPSH